MEEVAHGEERIFGVWIYRRGSLKRGLPVEILPREARARSAGLLDTILASFNGTDKLEFFPELSSFPLSTP